MTNTIQERKQTITFHESERLQALYGYQILDTAPTDNYDAFVALASSIFNTAVIYIAFVDQNRLWFKSSKGIPGGEIKDQYTFCHHTITSDSVFEVSDVYKNLKFLEIAAANKSDIQFYAGVPLTTPQGYRIGTFCIADYSPRKLKKQEKALLSILGEKVMNQLESDARSQELAQNKEILDSSLRELADSQADIDAITHAVPHELKSPLRSIHNRADRVSEEWRDTPSKELKYNLSFLRGKVKRLENLFNGFISYSKARKANYSHEYFHLAQMVQKLKTELMANQAAEIEVKSNLPLLLLEKEALYTIFRHLVLNSIVQNHPKPVRIEIGGTLLSDTVVEFYVQDDGIGTAPRYPNQIFGMFKVLHSSAKPNLTGLGITIIQNNLKRRKSHIKVDSLKGTGIRFSFTWPYKKTDLTLQ